jgi:tetratricopeptide (TPR) repeat protein
LEKTMSRTFALVFLIAVGAWTGAAAAQEEPSQLDEAARLTFEQAREDFVAGRYEQALARFRQAYQLSPRPGLLYNIAQTLDRLRRDEETVQALREYVQAVPDAPNRAEVEARIRVLDEALARQHANNPPPPPGGGTPPPPPSQGLAILHPAIFISVGGLALAGAGVLIWSGLETLSLNDAYNATTTYGSALTAHSRALDQQLLTNVFIGVTDALGAAAAALAIFTDWSVFGGGSEGSAQVAPLFGASTDGAWLGLGGSF